MLRNRKGNIDTDTTTAAAAAATINAGGSDCTDTSKSTKNKITEIEIPPTKVKVWILASRPHTLTASIVPVLVSSALIAQHVDASSSSYHHVSIIFASFACLIQLGTNLYNDYSDFIKGADTDSRVGHARATQKGWLSPKETFMGSAFCLGLASVLGLYLTSLVSSTTSFDFDYYMVFVTVSSVFNAFCYTGGEYPLGYIGLGHLSIGYSGLGDLFVFLYFGLVATITVPYLFLVNEQQQQQQREKIISTGGNADESVWKSDLMFKSFVTALPIGFLATAIIVVNNLRDRETDVVAGKNTMAVRFGEKFSRFEYTFLVVGSYVLLAPLSSILIDDADSGGGAALWLFLPLLSLPVAWKELKAVGFGGKDGAALNKHVGGAAKVQLLYSLLFIVGLYMSHF